MITIPALSSVTDILDSDLVMITHSNGESYKIAGSEINKRNQVIIASGTTITGAPLKTGNVVRVHFTADLTGSNTTTALVLTYNSVNYTVKVPKDGALANFVASNLGGSPTVYKYLQAYTTMELLYDGTYFVIIGNPVVLSGSNFRINADKSGLVNEVTDNNMNSVTSNAVAAIIGNMSTKSLSLSIQGERCYVLIHDITTWYNSTSTSTTQNRRFDGLLISARAGNGNTLSCVYAFTDTVGYYRNGASINANNTSDISCNKIAGNQALTLYKACVVKYQNKYYTAIKRDNNLNANIVFIYQANEEPLFTQLGANDPTEIYITE